jgi:hypothetical protein
MDAVKEKAHRMLEEKDAEIDRLKAESKSSNQAEELPPVVLPANNTSFSFEE